MSRRSWLKILFFFFAVVLTFTNATDADLLDREAVTANSITATTLDLGVKYPLNNSQISSLFSVFGLVYEGFDVKGIKVRREGDLGFDYRIRVEQTGGDAGLCNALELVFIKRWRFVSQSSLLSFTYEDTIPANKKRDKIILALLLEQDDPALMNKTCNFNIIVETVPGTDPGDTQFSDQEVLTNIVTTGSWTPGEE